MKQQLENIYQDLISGKLSQAEALKSIKALKVRNQVEETSALLAEPQWQTSTVKEFSSHAGQVFEEQHIMLCELPDIDIKELETYIPGSHCQSLKIAHQKTFADRYNDYAITCFERVQAILRRKPNGKILFQIIISDNPMQSVYAGLLGLLKTASLENPQLIGQCIVIGENTTTSKLAAHLQSDKSSTDDSFIKYKSGMRQVLQWQIMPTSQSKSKVIFKDRGVYLITGGLGGLGILFAKEILRQSAKARIILTGRSAPNAQTQVILNEISSSTDQLEYRQLSIGNIIDVKSLITDIILEHKQLNGIFHCAGMIADNFILKKTTEEFRNVLLPKVTGSYNLDQASCDIDLDFFVFFSSVASVMGNIGQADYAAANGFMDHFASYRNHLVGAGQRKGRTLSINWTFWHEGGMTIDPVWQSQLQQTTGIQPIQTETGVRALHQSLALQCEQVLVMQGDRLQLQHFLENQTLQPKTAPLLNTTTSINSTDLQITGVADGLLEETEKYLCKQFSKLLKIPSHKIDPQAGLEKYGIDSILAVNLISQLEKTFGPLSKTLLFEYQTLNSLAEYFVQSHSSRLTKLFTTQDTTGISNQSSTSNQLKKTWPTMESRQTKGRRFVENRNTLNSENLVESIAIVGLSGRYPEAVDIEAYWNNLRDGKDCIIEVPRERWDWNNYFNEDRTQSGYHFSKWGGFITGVDEFDPLFFNISPKEAKYIDPQERLFLQHTWMAIEDAGYTRASLQVPDKKNLAGQVGVYAGAMYSEYQLFGAEASINGERMALSGSFASIANRVSYSLNLHGPSMTLDTMCSSSLTAIHIACQDLKQGRTSLAIAGGVNVSIHPNKYLLLSEGQFISSDGHCQSFGEGGDGYIPGEGVGVVILKRLSEAERDGNHIYGVIRGSSLNHSGKTNGYTVPNPQAQTDVIRQAIDDANIEPRHVSYIEAHGTGTKLGDPIEITALSNVFRNDAGISFEKAGICAIGSAKSNIGHCESAAGIAGLTKVLLQMKHQTIVPSLHSKKLNPHIDFSSTPFFVNQSLKEWEQLELDGAQVPRIAGISSFGAGGSNAHLIVEEYHLPIRSSELSQTDLLPIIIPISARTSDQLQQKAYDLLGFIKKQNFDINLFSMAYTLQVGREAMEYRLAFLVESVEQLTNKLESYLAGEMEVDEVYQGQLKRNQGPMSLLSFDTDFKTTVDRWITDRKYSKLIKFWVNGLDLDWQRFFDNSDRPQLMSLPAYPFAKVRYWIDSQKKSVSGPNQVQSASILHPLLHTNTSDLQQQSYASMFSGAESFIIQDAITGQKKLPDLLGLEMMATAVKLASPTLQESAYWELHNCVWGHSMNVTGDRAIQIALLAREDDSIDVEIYSESGADDDDIIHCQSHIVYSSQTESQKLDIEQLKLELQSYSGSLPTDVTSAYQGKHQMLLVLDTLTEPNKNKTEYLLSPYYMATISNLINNFIGQNVSLQSIEKVQILFPCPKNILVWIREVSSTGIDIDICNKHGDVCMQLYGIKYEAEVISTPIHSIVESVESHSESSELQLISEPKEILLAPVETLSPYTSRKSREAIVLSKPKLVLAPRDKFEFTDSSSSMIAPPRNLLSQDSLSGTSTLLHPVVQLFDLGDGIFTIELNATTVVSEQSDVIIESLLHALDRVQQESSVKVLLIKGNKSGFWLGSRSSCNLAIQSKLFTSVASFPYPVIAVMNGDACGAGFILASVCDLMVCNLDGRYGFSDIKQGLFPSLNEECFFNERFGKVFTSNFLYQATEWSGRELKEKGLSCRIVPAVQVEKSAKELATDLAQKTHKSLHLLKTHLSFRLLPLVNALDVVDEIELQTPSNNNTNNRISSPTSQIKLETEMESTAVITILADWQSYSLNKMVSDLKNIFDQINRSSNYRSVILTGEHIDFIPQTNLIVNADTLKELRQLVQGCLVPVITAFRANAEGIAWLLGLWSDHCIYQRQGIFCATNPCMMPLQTQEVSTLFVQRLGISLGQEVCLSMAKYSGAELQARLAALTVVNSTEVMPQALKFAEFWGDWPLTITKPWKKSRVNQLEKIFDLQQELVKQGKEIATTEIDPNSAESASSESIDLDTNVVTVTAHSDGIVIIDMHDRQSKNMFSEELVSGLKRAFKHIEQTTKYKVVVLNGYDNYFASGGTKETLLAIQEGKIQFTDDKVFQLPMDCSIPVIAAMQGHGIGGGWSYGMFADFILFSEESRYISPYMDYGFTPGAGSTLVFPEKIGYDLARETLLTAREFSGCELAERGLKFSVLPRQKIVPAAIKLARRIAQHPRSLLVNLKRQWTHELRQTSEDIYQREVEMHEHTFVRKANTLENIQAKFFKADEKVEFQVSSNETTTCEGAELPAVLNKLRDSLAQELQLKPSEIEEDVQFTDLGLDSVTGVTWMRKINEHYDTSIEATQIYSNPTLAELSRFVKREVEKTGNFSKSITQSPQVEESQSSLSSTSLLQNTKVHQVQNSLIDTRSKLISWRKQERNRFPSDIKSNVKQSIQSIAVIGMAGQFPGANNIDEYWENIANGRDCVAEVANERWRLDDYFQEGTAVVGKTNSKWLGAMQEYDLFDPMFFAISPTEAESMDPQQRVILQSCWHSIEHAGYNPRELAESHCGVFVGCAASDYLQLSPMHQQSAQGFTGGATSILAARISYFLNLRGPCISIDTACSSSLVAIANACDSLTIGSCDLALAGGVYVMAGPGMHIMSTQAGMLSTSGRCYTFDQRADGFVIGEGVGSLMLKRLDDAERDGDKILGVIQAWGVNQDGKTNGITAPNAESQTRLIQSVYEKFNIDPGGIQLIEAHGTGTKLGDPIEIAGLKKAYEPVTGKQEYCALGSVKSNIGHCLTAAGVAGFIKLILSLRNKQLPPTIHYAQCNEHIKLDGSPFYVNDKLNYWRVADDEQRRAAISSFGFSGTNAHIVIGEYKSPVSSQLRKKPVYISQDGRVIIPLSARTEAQLQQKVCDLLEYVKKQEGELNIIEMAYTLQVGRDAMGARIGFLVGNIEELIAKVESYLEGDQDIAGVYNGHVKNSKDEIKLLSQDDDLKSTVINKLIQQRKLSKLLEFWVKGLGFDWNLLYADVKPQRIELPIYPFAKERYWLKTSGAQNPEVSQDYFIHPLLHRNTSLLSQQRYQSVFNGEEFFLDHRINGEKALPALSMIEMVRAAITHATSDQKINTSMNFKKVLWDQPLFVKGATEIVVVLYVNNDDSIRYEIQSDNIVYAQGLVELNNSVESMHLDISNAIKNMVNESFKPSKSYGKSLQGLKTVYRNEDSLFAEIKLPAVLNKYHQKLDLHPSILEGVLQACRIFTGDSTKHCLPISIESLSIISSCKPEMFASVHCLEDDNRVNVEIYDSAGKACLLIRGLELSSKTLQAQGNIWDGISYIYQWQRQTALSRHQPDNHKCIFVVYSDSEYRFEETITDHYQHKNNQNGQYIEDGKIVSLRLDDKFRCDPNSFQTILKDIDKVDTLYFLTKTNQSSDKYSIDESDEVQFLRLVKYLKQNNKIDGKIDTYILTTDNYCMNDGSSDYQGAGTSGLAYSLAQGNYQFRVRNLDLSSKNLKDTQSRKELFSIIKQELPSDRGEVIKIESGERYRQTFTRLDWGTSNPPVIKQNGVYLIVGGSGIVGQIITRNLIRKYQANVVWIGRTSKDSLKMQNIMRSFAEFGDKLLYVQADVLNLKSMQEAIAIIKRKYTCINGAIFSAMIFGIDNSIGNISEEQFKSVVEIKSTGSLIFYKSLSRELLDFMCYFSSGQAFSFSGASKVAAYAAGISFSDSFVRSIQKEAAFPVGTINWGAWQSFVEKRLNNNQAILAKNMGSFEDQDGFACFERFVNALQLGKTHQILCMNASGEVESLMNCSRGEIITLADERTSITPVLGTNITIPHEKIEQLKSVHTNSTLDDWFIELMFYQLNHLVEMTGSDTSKPVKEFLKNCGIQDKYIPWMHESLKLLSEQNFIKLENDTINEWGIKSSKAIWQKWQLQKLKFAEDPESKALTILVNDCLENLPGMLQGKISATDIIFPNSSMEKVAALYKNNAVADTFNEIVANATLEYLQQRLQADPKARIRILEIGAGTGGTSASVFSILSPYKQAIQEYCYTDLSKAFFLHAEKHYIPENPYIVCRRLDIEQPIETQGIECGVYDLVIATNVLHATRDIRETLRNTKAALNKNGFILLNEMSDKSLSTHLTVALLDGWWLFQDGNLRIPGCPGLYPDEWCRVLQEEGFSSVQFPASQGHVLGNQVIVAKSDGVIRQKVFVSNKKSQLENLQKSSKLTEEINPSVEFKAQNISGIKYVRSTILSCLSDTLNIPTSSIELDIAFSDYGIDSILGSSFVNQLNDRLHIELNSAVIFEYSSVDSLCNHIEKNFVEQIDTQLNSMQNAVPAQNEKFNDLNVDQQKSKLVSKNKLLSMPVTTVSKTIDSQIAVIGMAGRFPKAENVQEFWNNLIKGIDGVEELPAQYLDQNKYFTKVKRKGKTRCKWGGILGERDCFDPLFFNLSPKEAESMNPHQRLVMQECWNAIEDAGYNPKQLADSQTGIFIGSEPVKYKSETFTGLSDAIIASRLSYVLNLSGPAFVVNTGCSSSGVALHLACESLRNRETDQVIAGGVHACMGEETQIRLDEIEMLSPSGRCFTFDAVGDGTIISEGIGMVVLKRLEDAIDEGDHIYGTIIASGINQDGASNGITAPSGAAQEQLIKNVYDKFKINPENISYIEAHGTGTKLGDPVETNALVRAFGNYTKKQSYCAIGSAKSHIGHTAAAAGVIGLIKVLLSMQHKQMPKLLNFNTLNPLIEFDQSPFFINTETSDWITRGDAPRMAALNSFGHSGTNVHMVIKEYLPMMENAPQHYCNKDEGPFIIPLSAKSPEQLHRKSRELLEFIRLSSFEYDLASMAYTLQIGRESMESRLGFIVTSVEHLADKLQAFIKGEKHTEGIYQGQADFSDNKVEISVDALTNEKPENLIDLWCKGAVLDWSHFWRDVVKPQRMSLPGYPFAKERYWDKHQSLSDFPIPVSHKNTNENFESIAEIIDRISDESIETNEGVKLLKMIV